MLSAFIFYFRSFPFDLYKILIHKSLGSDVKFL